MAETTTGIVEDMMSREVNTRDGKPSRVYGLVVQGRKYETFRGELLSGAIIGEPVTVEYETQVQTRDGKEFTNHRLLSVQRPLGASEKPLEPLPARVEGFVPPVFPGGPADRETVIVRQTCCKVAGAVLSGKGWTLESRVAFEEIATMCFAYVQSGVFPRLEGERQ